MSGLRICLMSVSRPSLQRGWLRAQNSPAWWPVPSRVAISIFVNWSSLTLIISGQQFPVCWLGVCGGHASAGHSVLPSTLLVLTPSLGCKNYSPIAVDRGEAQPHTNAQLLLESQTFLWKPFLVSTFKPTCCNFGSVSFFCSVLRNVMMQLPLRTWSDGAVCSGLREDPRKAHSRVIGVWWLYSKCESACVSPVT